jgi:hypothetical protein
MVEKITANWDTLMKQATMTSITYMNRIVDEVDLAFGEGYAKEHPDLVGMLVIASAIDFASSSISAVMQQNME